jgi:hypothetical protein
MIPAQHTLFLSFRLRRRPERYVVCPDILSFADLMLAVEFRGALSFSDVAEDTLKCENTTS